MKDLLKLLIKGKFVDKEDLSREEPILRWMEKNKDFYSDDEGEQDRDDYG